MGQCVDCGAEISPSSMRWVVCRGRRTYRLRVKRGTMLTRPPSLYKREYLKAPRRKLTDKMRERIRIIRAKFPELEFGELADIFGISRPTLRRIIYPSEDGRQREILAYRYGITPEDIDNMLAEQKNACGICGDLFTEVNPYRIDHNHWTKQVRDLLCIRCNLAIGSARERPDILQRAILYLEKWSW